MHFLGDIHGDFYVIQNFCRKFGNQSETVNLIQVGDFGAGFESIEGFMSKMDYLNQILITHNVVVYAIRGNHDDPQYFDGQHNFWTNLKFIKDYDILNIENKNILFMGGAISIDRLDRVENKSWWRDEIFVLREDLLNKMTDIDIVVTHTAPPFAAPNKINDLVLSYAMGDTNLIGDLAYERNLLNQAWEILIKNNTIEKWYYGHFHFDKVEMLGGVEFNLLPINTTKEYVGNN